MSRIVILIGYHKPATLIKNSIVLPICMGREIVEQKWRSGVRTPELNWLIKKTIGDNSGDNISELNAEYGEMTGLYWAWKNYEKLGNPDYIGFMHYRRIFSFNAETQRRGGLTIPKLTPQIIEQHLDVNDIIREVESFDAILPKPLTLYASTLQPDNQIRLKEPRTLISNWEAYANLHSRKDLEKTICYIRKKYPAYVVDIDDYMNSHEGYYKNMFILRKKLFFEYCEYAFDVLTSMDKQIDRSNYSLYNQRVLGFLSERVTGIFLNSKRHDKNLKIKHIPMAFIQDTASELLPAYQHNNIAIFCSTDDNYAAYCGVMLSSIIAHASPQNNYDIIVLEQTLSRDNRLRLSQLTYGHPNISIRFYNVSHLMKGREGLHLCAHFTIETYFRLMCTTVFSQYEKLVYLDIDTIVMHDIADLFSQDMGDNWVAAALDIGVMGKIKAGRWEPINYFQKELGVKDPYNEYFSAAVMLFNIKKMKEYDIEQKLLTTASEHKYFYVDQDVLNKVCYGHVLILDSGWNVTSLEGRKKQTLQLAPARHYKKWLQDRDSAKIIHYASYVKPWSSPNSDLAAYWWKYARQSPFYEEIIYRNIKDASVKESQQSVQITEKKVDSVKSNDQYRQIKELAFLPDYRRKLKRMSFKTCISWGSKKKKYIKRKEQLENKIKSIEQFLKGQVK